MIYFVIVYIVQNINVQESSSHRVTPNKPQNEPLLKSLQFGKTMPMMLLIELEGSSNHTPFCAVSRTRVGHNSLSMKIAACGVQCSKNLCTAIGVSIGANCRIIIKWICSIKCVGPIWRISRGDLSFRNYVISLPSTATAQLLKDPQRRTLRTKPIRHLHRQQPFSPSTKKALTSNNHNTNKLI